MENKKPKCSLKEHNEFDADSCCPRCEIYMCNKCEKVHLGLCQKHNSIALDKDISLLFSGLCKIENHQNWLYFFVKIIMNYAVQIALLKLKGKDLDSIVIVICVTMKIF